MVRVFLDIGVYEEDLRGGEERGGEGRGGEGRGGEGRGGKGRGGEGRGGKGRGGEGRGLATSFFPQNNKKRRLRNLSQRAK